MASIRESTSFISNARKYQPNVEITEKYMERKYHINDLKQDDVIYKTAHYLKKNYKPSKYCINKFFYKRLPIFDWIRRYDIKHDLIKDFIAGMTVYILNYLL
jgi:hypothetical protein